MTPSHQKGLSRIEVLVTILVALGVLVIVVTVFLRHRSNLERTNALNNAKALAGGLVAFKTDMGAYPCESTYEAMVSDGWENLRAETDANAYLAQLLATDIIDDEGVFYATGVRIPTKGDCIKGTTRTLLAPGENDFAYIMAANEEPLTDVSSNTPLVLAPLLKAGEVPTFDPKPFNGKGVYGKADGSGALFTINKKGHAVSEDGVELFATGSGSLFGKETPVVKAPTRP